MGKKIVLGVLAAAVLLGGLAYLMRVDIVLYLAANRGLPEVGPNRAIEWQTPDPARAAKAKEGAPNIIFILADDMGINDVSTFGGGMDDGRMKTPHIDSLATDGASFTQAYAGTGSCAPSRAMIMTGRYPSRTGFEFTPTPEGMAPLVRMIASSMDNGLPEFYQPPQTSERQLSYEEQGLPGSEVTVAEVLQDAGYHTVHIGKWHLGRGEEFDATAQGFDESLLMASGLFLPEDDPNVVNAKVDFDPIDQFLWARMQYAASYNNSEWFEPGGYITDYWTDEAQKVIRANKDNPFFLYLAHWGIHTPLQATREDYEAVGDIKPHRARVYAAMMRAVDRSVGDIIETLEEEGIADNTIIVFSSDNGGAGYIGLPDVNAPYRGWKLTLFEGGIRVPMLMRWPDQIAAGTQIASPVAHIDLMPTLAAAGGASVPDTVELDGKDLLPLATGATTEDPHDAIFWTSAHYRVVRQGDWKLQLSERPNKAWLFNLGEDPTEQTNLADQNSAKLAELTALLDAHSASARPPLYTHQGELPIAIDKTLAERYEEGDELIFWPN
ncbi:Sulfatase, family S1 subfamily 41 [Candidatus Phaeomarinobacter ectocarpi]|uniref:Sulfatase, family S1 subfamily 41 n=1 Tax=Candidatus Phaeomarinibacter ectocarpi TaxID=1458461 RepID=X5MAV6_9HYPH|nr:sulfatase [Candidatus Phaeomarinobacter ectocarpi]CDO61108.1 Sulfatase, family S1 subfamily 41 [Candidatus Phaeomarinobacter ectocarpi]